MEFYEFAMNAEGVLSTSHPPSSHPRRPVNVVFGRSWAQPYRGRVHRRRERPRLDVPCDDVVEVSGRPRRVQGPVDKSRLIRDGRETPARETVGSVVVGGPLYVLGAIGFVAEFVGVSFHSGRLRRELRGTHGHPSGDRTKKGQRT